MQGERKEWRGGERQEQEIEINRERVKAGEMARKREGDSVS